jgi:outer membrane lipoprotein-sorting protein
MRRQNALTAADKEIPDMMVRFLAGVVCFPLIVLGTAARADEKADILLKQVTAAEKAVRTLTADAVITHDFGGQKQTKTGTVKLKKPNLARIELSGPTGQTIASDGKTVWILDKETNQYFKMPWNSGVVMGMTGLLPVAAFFDSDMFGKGKLPASAMRRYMGTKTVAGVPYRVVESRQEPVIMQVYIGPDNLIRRSTILFKQGNQTTTMQASLTNMRINRPLANAVFAYKPPKTAKLYQQPDYNSKLIPIGRDAPIFSIPAPSGGQTALPDALTGKKAVVVNFWFHG